MRRDLEAITRLAVEDTYANEIKRRHLRLTGRPPGRISHGLDTFPSLPLQREALMTRPRPRIDNRRAFLAQAGGLAAIAAGAPFGIGDVNLSAEELGPRKPHQRVADAYKLRHEAALSHKGQPLPSHDTNGDDTRYANAVASFTKTLPHAGDGLVVSEAYAALRHA